jgi:two-component system LytT family response regulator
MNTKKLFNYVIIEDEREGTELLKRLLELYFPNAKFLGSATGVEDGVVLINKKNPDLLFLDIEIRGGTGFDVLDQTSREFKVVFTTGYDKYALKAIKYSAFDYLLKPIQIDDIKIVARKLEMDLIPTGEDANINPLKENFGNIVVFNNGKRETIPLADIVSLEADGKYTRIICANDSKLMSSYNLGYYEDLLTDSSFVRIHHSVLINLVHLRKTNLKHQMVIMSNNVEYIISQRRFKLIRHLL